MEGSKIGKKFLWRSCQYNSGVLFAVSLYLGLASLSFSSSFWSRFWERNGEEIEFLFWEK